MATVSTTSRHMCDKLAPSANMDDLPAEMLVMIFVKLDSVTRTRCERVCQRWMDFLRQTEQLQKIVKLDFSISYDGKANAHPGRNYSSQVAVCISRHLWGLARKLAKMEVLILTDESYNIELEEPSKFEPQRSRTPESNIEKPPKFKLKPSNFKPHRIISKENVFSLLYMPTEKSKPRRLVLHRILVDMSAIRKSRFYDIVFDNVHVAHGALCRRGQDTSHSHREDFHIDYATLLVADGLQGYLQLRRQFWLSLPEERIKEFLAFSRNFGNLGLPSILGFVRLVLRNEGLQSNDQKRVLNLLWMGDAAFMKGLLPSTKADLWAHLRFIENGSRSSQYDYAADCGCELDSD